MMQFHPSPSGTPSRTRSFLLVALTLMTMQLSVAAPGALAAPKPKPSSINLVPLVTGITFENGQLFANGIVTATIKGVTTTKLFHVPVTIAAHPNSDPAASCAILDLSLGPITLDLLGLVVQTSPICLTITAFENGGLLGDLLCNVANLLNNGLSLSDLLSGLGLPLLGLPGVNPVALLSGLTQLFNAALAEIFNVIPTVTHVGQGHTCAILHLSLGPVTLNLLGLVVDLDNCANGPVIVDITAVTGQGNLLGNLLCELLDGGLLSPGLTLGQILNQILSLLNQ